MIRPLGRIFLSERRLPACLSPSPVGYIWLAPNWAARKDGALLRVMLAPGHALEMFRIASSLDGDLGRGGFELGDFFGRELDQRGTDVFR